MPIFNCRPSSGGSSGSSIDVKIYDTAGVFTWTKPANAKICEIFMMPGGQGGDNGGAFGSGSGNGGNGAARAFAFKILADDLGATETVVVGAGGTGSPAGIAPSWNNAPSGYSAFGDFIVSDGGDLVYPDREGNIDFTSGNWIIRPGDGGSGGANTSAGSDGTNSCSQIIPILGGVGGLTDADGNDGENSPFSVFWMDASLSATSGTKIMNKYQTGGGGGSGGGGETSVKPGAGGNGGWPGGGGGGGGEAADGGSATGGAGGDGADGVVIVITTTG